MKEQQQPIFTKRFMSLFFTNMAVFLVFYGLVTTLPLYAIGVLHRPDEQSGWLVTAFLVSAIVMRPFSGKLLDVFGKKRFLVVSLIMYLVCTILYIVFKEFTVLLGLRFFQGIWFSIATTAAGSLAADTVPANRKGTGIGYFALSTNLAIVIGPFISLFAVQHASFDVLFIILSVIITIGCLFAIGLKGEARTQKERVKTKMSWNDLFEKKSVPFAFLASFIAISYSSVLSFLSLYADEKNLLTAASYFYFVLAIGMMGVRPLTGRIYDTYGPKFIIIPSFLLFAIGLAMIGSADGPVLFLASALFLGAGYGTLMTSFQSLCVQATTPDRTSYATATYFTFFDIGIAFGSYILGIIAVSMSYHMVYMLCAALMIVMLIVYALFFAKKKFA